jgi:hypothetical protein
MDPVDGKDAQKLAEVRIGRHRRQIRQQISSAHAPSRHGIDNPHNILCQKMPPGRPPSRAPPGLDGAVAAGEIDNGIHELVRPIRDTNTIPGVFNPESDGGGHYAFPALWLRSA